MSRSGSSAAALATEGINALPTAIRRSILFQGSEVIKVPLKALVAPDVRQLQVLTKTELDAAKSSEMQATPLPHEQFFLTYWKPKGKGGFFGLSTKSSSRKAIPISAIREVVRGANTTVFRQARKAGVSIPDSDQCFSVLTAERSLDVVCWSEEDASGWVTGLHALIAWARDASAKTKAASAMAGAGAAAGGRAAPPFAPSAPPIEDEEDGYEDAHASRMRAFASSGPAAGAAAPPPVPGRRASSSASSSASVVNATSTTAAARRGSNDGGLAASYGSTRSATGLNNLSSTADDRAFGASFQSAATSTAGGSSSNSTRYGYSAGYDNSYLTSSIGSGSGSGASSTRSSISLATASVGQGQGQGGRAWDASARERFFERTVFAYIDSGSESSFSSSSTDAGVDDLIFSLEDGCPLELRTPAPYAGSSPLKGQQRPTASGDGRLTLLQYACRVGNHKAARLLLERGSEFDPDRNPLTDALALAVRGSHFLVADEILNVADNTPKLTEQLLCQQRGRRSNTLLHMACARHCLAIVRLLLRRCTHPIFLVNQPHSRTPLMMACAGRCRSAPLSTEAGATSERDPAAPSNDTDGEEEEELEDEEEASEGVPCWTLELEEALLVNARIAAKKAQEAAAMAGSPSMGGKKPHPSSMAVSPIPLALANKEVEALEARVEELYATAAKDHLAVLRDMLEGKEGRDSNAEIIDLPDDNGDTCLHLCCASGHPRVVRYLMESGAAVDVDVPNNKGETPAHAAVKAFRAACAAVVAWSPPVSSPREHSFGPSSHVTAAKRRALELLVSGFQGVLSLIAEYGGKALTLPAPPSVDGKPTLTMPRPLGAGAAAGGAAVVDARRKQTAAANAPRLPPSQHYESKSAASASSSSSYDDDSSYDESEAVKHFKTPAGMARTATAAAAGAGASSLLDDSPSPKEGWVTAKKPFDGEGDADDDDYDGDGGAVGVAGHGGAVHQGVAVPAGFAGTGAAALAAAPAGGRRGSKVAASSSSSSSNTASIDSDLISPVRRGQQASAATAAIGGSTAGHAEGYATAAAGTSQYDANHQAQPQQQQQQSAEEAEWVQYVYALTQHGYLKPWTLAYEDTTYHCYYFSNEETGESAWEPPPAVLQGAYDHYMNAAAASSADGSGAGAVAADDVTAVSSVASGNGTARSASAGDSTRASSEVAAHASSGAAASGGHMGSPSMMPPGFGAAGRRPGLGAAGGPGNAGGLGSAGFRSPLSPLGRLTLVSPQRAIIQPPQAQAAAAAAAGGIKATVPAPLATSRSSYGTEAPANDGASVPSGASSLDNSFAAPELPDNSSSMPAAPAVQAKSDATALPAAQASSQAVTAAPPQLPVAANPIAAAGPVAAPAPAIAPAAPAVPAPDGPLPRKRIDFDHVVASPQPVAPAAAVPTYGASLSLEEEVTPQAPAPAPAAAPASATGVLEDKWTRMARMGVPVEAVCRKMDAEGVAPSLVEQLRRMVHQHCAVEGKPVSSLSLEGAGATTTKAPEPAAASSSSTSADPLLAQVDDKYMKMLRMGVPAMAVIRKIQSEVTDKPNLPAIVAALEKAVAAHQSSGKPMSEFGLSAASAAPASAPPAAPAAVQQGAGVDERFLKMIRMGVPHHAVSKRMEQEGVPAAAIAALVREVEEHVAKGQPLSVFAKSEPAAPAAASAPSGPPVDPLLAQVDDKYMKMLRMGVPAMAVIRKIQSEVTDKPNLAAVVAALEKAVAAHQGSGKPMSEFGLSAASTDNVATEAATAPSAPSSAVDALLSPEAARKAAQEAVSLDPKFAKYEKMKKMGVPLGAIRGQMGGDGLAMEDIALFLKAHATQAALESMGLAAALSPRGKDGAAAVAGKGGADDKNAAAQKAQQDKEKEAEAAAAAAAASGPVTLKLHWQPLDLPEEKLNRTIWGKLKDRKAAAAAAAASKAAGSSSADPELKDAMTRSAAIDDDASPSLDGPLSALTSKDSISGDGGDAHVSLITTLFAAKPAAAPLTSVSTKDGKEGFGGSGEGGAGGPATPVAVALTTTLDPRRANNLNIMLAAFKKFPDHAAICSAVYKLTSGPLKREELDKLTALIPKPDELRSVKQYKGDPATLMDCDRFFLSISKVPRFPAKIAAFITVLSFDDIAADILRRATTIKEACSQVVNSEPLQVVLGQVLNLGNILNKGSLRLTAQAITLESLLKLSVTKASTDKKISLMDALAMTIQPNASATAGALSLSPTVIDLDRELPLLGEAKRLEVGEAINDLKGLVAALQAVQREGEAEAADLAREEEKERAASGAASTAAAGAGTSAAAPAPPGAANPAAARSNALAEMMAKRLQAAGAPPLPGPAKPAAGAAPIGAATAAATTLPANPNPNPCSKADRLHFATELRAFAKAKTPQVQHLQAAVTAADQGLREVAEFFGEDAGKATCAALFTPLQTFVGDFSASTKRMQASAAAAAKKLGSSTVNLGASGRL